MALDDDAIIAALDLVGRTGAKRLEFGYLHDDVPAAEADWWAHAQYDGARITESGHVGAVEALEALARRLLTGAKCVHCGGLVALSDSGAFAYNSTRLVDGTEWTAGQAAAAGQCRWRRNGPKWQRGCEENPHQPGQGPAEPQRRAAPPGQRRQPKRTSRRRRRSK